MADFKNCADSVTDVMMIGTSDAEEAVGELMSELQALVEGLQERVGSGEMTDAGPAPVLGHVNEQRMMSDYEKKAAEEAEEAKAERRRKDAEAKRQRHLAFRLPQRT